MEPGSPEHIDQIDIELAAIHMLMKVSTDEDLKNILLIRVDILENELSMIAEEEETQSFYDRRVIDAMLGEETSHNDEL